MFDLILRYPEWVLYGFIKLPFQLKIMILHPKWMLGYKILWTLKISKAGRDSKFTEQPVP